MSVTFSNEELEQLKSYRRKKDLTDNDKDNIDILLAIAKGEDKEFIKDKYYISQSKIYGLIKKYKEKGIDGIINVKVGKPKKLTTQEEEKILQVLKHSPIEIGYSFQDWTGFILQQYIKDTFKKDLNKRSCEKLLGKYQQAKEPQSPQDVIQRIKEAKEKQEADIWILSHMQIWKEKKSSNSRKIYHAKYVLYIASNIAKDELAHELKEVAIVSKNYEDGGYISVDKDLESYMEFLDEVIHEGGESDKVILIANKSALNRKLLKESICHEMKKEVEAIIVEDSDYFSENLIQYDQFFDLLLNIKNGMKKYVSRPKTHMLKSSLDNAIDEIIHKVYNAQ